MANCPSCRRYFAKKMDAIDHINRYHSAEADERGMTAAQWLYASTHNGDYHGKCMICGKPTDWSARTMKPYKLCSNPQCRAAVKAQYDKNRDAKLHMSQSELMSNMDHQREMLSHRKISGRYKFRDGGEVEYVANLELRFLQFCDRILELRSIDILPSPDVFSYFDPKDGKDHSYIPDYYLPMYDLMVEVKDKANGNPAFLEETRYKVALKDDAMRKQTKYHYIRISGSNYGPFMEMLFKITHGEDKNDPNRKNIIMISEAATIPTKQDVLFKTVYGTDNTLKLFAMSDTHGTWYVSNYDEKTLTVDTADNVEFAGSMYRVFKYLGDQQDLASVISTIKANAINTSGCEWDIMEILKTGNIRFNDLNGNGNNADRRSDFEMVDSDRSNDWTRKEDDE